MKKILFFSSLLITLQGLSQSKNMRLLGLWTDTTLATNAGGYTYNECFGFVTKGVEYGIIGSTQGTHIIDISDPDSLVEVDFVPGKYRGNVTHRDFDVRNGYLYMVCDQASSSLQIADLSTLPDSVNLVYDNNALIVKSHNIFIDSANDILYSCGGSKLSGNNDLRMIDISNPLSPSLIADLDDDVSWWGSFVGYVHDIYVKNNIAYTNDADAMHIIDMTNPTMPIILGTISSYSDKGYNHSGFLMDDDTTYVMCDETHGKRTKFMDVSDPTSIQVTDLEGPALPNTDQIPHNPIIKGHLAYVSYYYDGVQVYDIRDKYNVKNVGFYDTYQGPNAPGGEGCWGVYPLLPSGKILASDRRRGLFVLDHLLPPAVSFDTNAVTYGEFDGLQHIFIETSNEFDDTVKVLIDIDTANSTADWNIDYTVSSAFPVELIFVGGKTLDSIPFMLIDNIDIESTETLLFNITTVVNGEYGIHTTDTVFITDNEVLNTKELKKERISFYPNPVNSGNEVKFSKTVNFTLADASGKLILNDRGNNFSTLNLAKGVYVLQYEGISKKLIIQ